MRNRLPGVWAVALLCAAVVTIAVSGPPLQAQTLTLTQDGMNLGFNLSTFATLDPGNYGCCTGPFGVAYAAPDRVLVFNSMDNTRYVFHDVDGQTKNSAITSTTNNPTFVQGYATLGGNAYGSTFWGGQFAQYNNNGEISRVLSGVPETTYDGMWGNPVTGHILATTSVPGGSIIDIDPNANGGLGSSRTVTTGVFDGVTVSPDGKVVYGAQGNFVLGFDIATGAQIFNSGFLPDIADGTAVITSNNNLNGDLIINFNGNGFNTGFVGLLDPKTDKLTMIASGGTRGDYASPDPTNGSLFLDYSDVVYRLSCGPDCGIGTSPEPGTLTMLGSGLAGLAGVLYRRTRR